MINQDTVALVTGTNRGIGAALVHALADAGIGKIYAAVRSSSSLAGTSLPEGTIPVEVDVTQPEEVARIAARAADTTVLFNNVGILAFGDIMTAPWNDVQANLEVNYLGKLRLARGLAPVIERNGGGAIVNMLTLVALASMPGLAVYNALKAAARSMTQSQRASLASRNIRVHGVFPGVVDTAMLSGVDMKKASAADVARAILKGVMADEEDSFPDAMSTSLYVAWAKGHKAVEARLARM